MMNKTWTLEVKEDPETGDAILEFPEDLMESAGWKEGDELTWIDNKNGSYTLKKKEPTEWVLVECVSTFRERYMVEVPVGKKEWALDTVVMNEAKEFSQEHLGEHIVSHRVVTKEEALTICDEDNQYCNGWPIDKKESAFFTRIGEKVEL